MDHTQTFFSSSAAHCHAISGCWKLEPGRALTLRASQPGELRIARGRVWITFDDAAQDANMRAGDYFLSQGERLHVSTGQALVMESFKGAHAASAYFSWEPVAAPACVPASPAPGPASLRAAVAPPLQDLRLALGLASAAVGRLARVVMRGVTGTATA